jgi:hypothetical protein
MSAAGTAPPAKGIAQASTGTGIISFFSFFLVLYRAFIVLIVQ